MRLTVINLLLAVISLGIGARKLAAQQQSAAVPPAFQMTSVYHDEDWIPLQYTCGIADGSSPAVQWTGALRHQPRSASH